MRSDDGKWLRVSDEKLDEVVHLLNDALFLTIVFVRKQVNLSDEEWGGILLSVLETFVEQIDDVHRLQ